VRARRPNRVGDAFGLLNFSPILAAVIRQSGLCVTSYAVKDSYEMEESIGDIFDANPILSFFCRDSSQVVLTAIELSEVSLVCRLASS
jgi:hypothetical protein